MNVTYKDLKDGYILKDRDEIVIHGAKHRAMLSEANNEYYLNYEGVSNDALDYERTPDTACNDFIFHLLHIPDKESFVRVIAGKDFSGGGSFPQVKTLEALTKVAIALLEKPLYYVGDYVTVRKAIEGHKYSLSYWEFMQVFAGKTLAVTKIEPKEGNAAYTDSDGEIYLYELANNFVWDIAMIMPATEEEKKSLDVPDNGEPEEKKEEKIHFVTLEDLKDGYIFKQSDHIRINGMDCLINTNAEETRFWLSSDTILEQEIYDSLGIPDDKKKELAKLCGAVDLSFQSPEFSSLVPLSNFVEKILMYKKEDETSSKKKWSGNPTYFDLKNGRILEKGDILNIHGIEYCVVDGCSEGKRCWLGVSGVRNSVIFDKLRIEDKYDFVNDICAVVSTGDFPEVGSFEDLTKVAIALFQVPEFKVGDKVKVAYRKDGEDDYPWSFTDEMTSLQGKVYTIKRAVMVTSPLSDFFGGMANERLSQDPSCYYLNADGRDFSWHSSMLEKVSESDKKSEESSKEESFVKPSQISLSDIQLGYTLKNGDIAVLRGDASTNPLSDVIRWERINFSRDISKSDEPSDTGNVRLPEIKDDFKIIL